MAHNPNNLKLEDDTTNKAGKSSDNDEGSETEIVTEIIVPEEGRWRWVVVAGSFMCAFITDGSLLSFGSIYMNMTEEFGLDVSLITLVNSITMALFFLLGPIVSAFVNRFGIRICTMAGSIIVSFSCLATYFSHTYALLVLFYGFACGIGASFINLPAQLIVGFYFERLRALAMGIASLGVSFGITILSKINTIIVQLTGWRTVVLLQSGLFGLIYFIAMVFRPLLSLSVTTEKVHAVTHLPSISKTAVKEDPEQSKAGPPNTSPTEKLLGALSNARFPTAANVYEQVESEPTGTSQGPPKRRLTLVALTPEDGMSTKQIKQAQSITLAKSTSNVKIVQINKHEKPKKKRHWCLRCCTWERHVKESRPMYKDDAFYQGSIQKLPAYKEQVLESKSETKTGLEYQMAVTRATAVSDLEERKGLCTTAVRRVLATMLDPKLLKRNSFFMVCLINLLIFMSIYIPILFLADRNREMGIDEVHCQSFVSVIGVCNALGRINAGLLACKFNVIKIYITGCVMSGLSVILSNFSYDPYFQYSCCVMYGFSSAPVFSLRSPVLVELYGLENLTNAIGMVLVFCGLGSLISSPLAMFLRNLFGFEISFYTAGTLSTLSGLIMINVKRIATSEVRKQANMIQPGKYSSIVIKNTETKSVEDLPTITEKEVVK